MFATAPKCNYTVVTSGERFEIHTVHEGNSDWLRIWDTVRCSYVWDTMADDMKGAERKARRLNRNA